MTQLTTRLTSDTLYIEFTPFGSPSPLEAKLNFNSAVTGGTFKLEVNGEKTANITFNATPATFVTSIDTALDALPNLAAGAIESSATVSTLVDLDSIANEFYYVRVTDIALIPATVVSPVILSFVSQGSKTVELTAQASSFETGKDITMIDVTALSDYAVREIPSKESLSFSISLFDGDPEIKKLLNYQKLWGSFYIYKEGKVVGKTFEAFNAHVSSITCTYPDHEKLEINIDGARFGDYITPPETVFRG